MRVSAILAAVAVAGVAGAAQADEWATGADVRCVVAFTALISNPTYKDAAASGIFYYVGRLEGRDPTLDLAKSLRQVRGMMQASQFGTEAQRCGAELKAKNDELKAMSSGAQSTPARGVGVR